MSPTSAPDLLVLHAVRILGLADTPTVAHRFGLDFAVAEEHLLDAEAFGWVQRASFANLRGWSLTAAGQAQNERRLRDELDRTGTADRIRDAYRAFLPLNGRLRQACTEWQLRPTPADELAENDHSDTAWDARVLDELSSVGGALSAVADQLSAALPRFGGYESRFDTALRRARGGEPGWVDRTDVDSCHRVWFELHEDLVATLGVDRSAEHPSGA
jgi:hypothetical protein